MKTIVRCFARWLDTPEAAEIFAAAEVGANDDYMPANREYVTPNEKQVSLGSREAAMLSHTVKHAGPVPVAEAKPLTGFASLLSASHAEPAAEKIVREWRDANAHCLQSEVTESPSVAVGEFRATVNGQLKRVRMLDKVGGVLRVQVIRDDGGLSLTILTNIEQVHVDDRARVAHLFPDA